jgi:hypothetical protein
MRHALFVAALAGVIQFLPATSAPAEAQVQRIYPFCYVSYGIIGAHGTYQCNFTSFAQCMATASGLGGQCEQNPELVAQTQQPAQKRKPVR